MRVHFIIMPYVCRSRTQARMMPRIRSRFLFFLTCWGKRPPSLCRKIIMRVHFIRMPYVCRSRTQAEMRSRIRFLSCRYYATRFRSFEIRIPRKEQQRSDKRKHSVIGHQSSSISQLWKSQLNSHNPYSQKLKRKKQTQ
jgi:hypothetical protein